MGKRKQAKALARLREAEIRSWALATARQLAFDLYQNRPAGLAPYRAGVVLDRGEVIWADTPIRFDAEPPPAWVFVNARPSEPPAPPLRSWLITNARVVARLGDDQLHGYRWEYMTGCRVGLEPGHEFVALDLDRKAPLVWRGPGIAPLAIAAVFHLYGPDALVHHPGLAPLRALSNQLAGDDNQTISARPELTTAP